MDYVESDVCRTYDTDYSVQVGSVIVAESAGFMYESCDLHDVRVKETYCVRVSQHQAGCLRTEVSLEVVKVNCTTLIRLDNYCLVACHRCRSRVGAVSSIRYEDLASLGITSVGVISLDQKESCELAVRASFRGQR